MVKTFDMERTDLTVQFIENISRWQSQSSLLSTDAIMSALKAAISNQKEYIEANGGLQKMPSVILKSRCKDTSRYSRRWSNFEYLPAFYDHESHSISLCTDQIRHPKKLEENFTRELIVGTMPPKTGLSPDENLARACYLGCQTSLAHYTADRKRLESMVAICTKHVFKVG